MTDQYTPLDPMARVLLRQKCATDRSFRMKVRDEIERRRRRRIPPPPKPSFQQWFSRRFLDGEPVRKQAPATMPKVTPSSVLRATAIVSGLDVDHLTGPSRGSALVHWRVVAIIIMARRCGWMTPNAIGQKLNRDRTTVLHSQKKYNATPGTYDADIERVEMALGRGRHREAE